MGSVVAHAPRRGIRPGRILIRATKSNPPTRAGRVAKRNRYGLWFVMPLFALFVLFMLTPVAYAIYTSLFSSTLIGGTHFAGFSNFVQTFESPDFWGGMERVMLFAVITVPLTIGLGAFFAVMFDLGLTRFGRVLRTIFFLPFTVPAVVAAVMWSYLLEPTFGPFSRLAGALGVHGTNFFSPSLILPTIIVIVVWEVTGWNMIVLYAALKAVPHEVMEAAAIDGARLRRAILSVKLPMIRPAIVMLVFLNTIAALQLFAEPEMLATFQPQAISSGFTPTVFIYNTAINNGEYNLAAATAIIFGLFIFVISCGSLVFRRRGAVVA